MKKLLLFIFLLFVLLSSPFCQTITLGSQIWTTKNLNVDKFRNGDKIPQAKTAEEWKKAGENKQPAWCYYNNDPANGTKFGKLYNWYAVIDPRGLAPIGYHIPTIEEWSILEKQIGENAGKKMKSITGWKSKGNGTNESGFNSLPAGDRYITGIFSYLGQYCSWWSSDEYSSEKAWIRGLGFGGDGLGKGNYDKVGGISVRCIKD